MVQSDVCVFEICDSYQKQTYRNRCYIYGANGKLSLNIPIHFTQKNRQNTDEIEIENASKWQSIHWKSIESAYKTSPFFEFYEDEFKELFDNQKDFLLDFNLECITVINRCLGFEPKISFSDQFSKTNPDFKLKWIKLLNLNHFNLNTKDIPTQLIPNFIHNETPELKESFFIGMII